MSLSENYNFIAGDEDLKLHRLFSFNEITGAPAADLPPPAEDLPALPRLGSPFAGPPCDLQGQFSWLSPSAAGPNDVLDAINFDDFLAIDGSSDGLLAAVEELHSLPPPLPTQLADPSPAQDKLAADPEPTEDFPAEDLPVDAYLEAARDEIAQLKAAMAAESPQPEVSTTPGGRQSSSSSPRKRKLNDSEGPPPKRQTIDQVGPIEALWSSKINESERVPVHNNLPSPTTPKPSSPQHNFTTQPFTPHINTLDDCAISPEDIQSIQAFIKDNPVLVYGTSHPVNIFTPPSNITMEHPVNTKTKRVPPKSAPRRAPKTTTNANSKITKKHKATLEKPQHQRKASASPHNAPLSAASTSQRSIDELLVANFYGLNAQEKLRIMLPMLRNLDPKELEESLAKLPCIQAKGAGHEVRVARTIHESPPTPEDDDILATKLTFGFPPSPALATKRSSTSPPAPVLQAPPCSPKITHVMISEDHGAVRQREALKKAALLQAQGKKI